MANRIENRGEWSTDKSKFEWIEIPARDMYDHAYPTIRINAENFESGKRHFVPPEVAGELRRIMDRFEVDSRRLLLPTPNKSAQRVADGEGRGQ